MVVGIAAVVYFMILYFFCNYSKFSFQTSVLEFFGILLNEASILPVVPTDCVHVGFLSEIEGEGVGAGSLKSPLVQTGRAVSI